MIQPIFPVRRISSEEASPYNSLLSNALRAYHGMTNAQYANQEKQADIFSKNFNPMAQFAISPLAEGLNPKQKAVAQELITQQLMQLKNKNQPLNNPISNLLNKFSGKENNNYKNMNSGQQIGNKDQNTMPDIEDNLVPKDPGEHYTGEMKQSPYTSGTAHRGRNGETIYAPSSEGVTKGLDVISEAKGLKNLFNEYSKLAPKVGGAGGVKRELSILSSGIEKTEWPYSKQISDFFGGSTLSDQAANFESIRDQMAPALRAIGFSNSEIDGIFKFYPGETEKNIKDRLKKTWPIIEQKIKTHQKNLSKGINANQNIIGENEVPKNIDQKIKRDKKERSEAQQFYRNNYDKTPEGTKDMYLNGELYFIPTKDIQKALKKGFNYDR